MKFVGSERSICFFRHHWLWLAKRIVSTLFIFIVALVGAMANLHGVVTIIALVTLLISALVILYWILEWRQRKLWVTTQRVVLEGGIIPFIAESDEIGLAHVQNIDVTRDGFKALLGCFSYNIQTGHGTLVAEWFPKGISEAIWSARGDIDGNGSQPIPPIQSSSEPSDTIVIDGF